MADSFTLKTEDVETFIKEMYDDAYYCLDHMNEPNFDMDPYDITITINGKSLVIPMCADTYSELEQYIRNCKAMLDE